MEIVSILSSLAAATFATFLFAGLAENRRLQRDLNSLWAAHALAEQNHGMQMRSLAESQSSQFRDFAITLTAQGKAKTAAEAVEVHHAIQAASEPPTPAVAIPPPAKGLKLRDGSEIEFITEPTDGQMEEVDDEMVLR